MVSAVWQMFPYHLHWLLLSLLEQRPDKAPKEGFIFLEGLRGRFAMTGKSWRQGLEAAAGRIASAGNKEVNSGAQPMQRCHPQLRNTSSFNQPSLETFSEAYFFNSQVILAHDKLTILTTTSPLLVKLITKVSLLRCDMPIPTSPYRLMTFL